jgi:hypothetical protein
MSPRGLAGAAQIKGAVASPGPLQTGNARVSGLGSIGAKLCISTPPDKGPVECKSLISFGAAIGKGFASADRVSEDFRKKVTKYE